MTAPLSAYASLTPVQVARSVVVPAGGLSTDAIFSRLTDIPIPLDLVMAADGGDVTAYVTVGIGADSRVIEVRVGRGCTLTVTAQSVAVVCKNAGLDATFSVCITPASGNNKTAPPMAAQYQGPVIAGGEKIYSVPTGAVAVRAMRAPLAAPIVLDFKGASGGCQSPAGDFEWQPIPPGTTVVHMVNGSTPLTASGLLFALQ